LLSLFDGYMLAIACFNFKEQGRYICMHKPTEGTRVGVKLAKPLKSASHF